MKRFLITLTVISAAIMELIDTSIVNVALSQMAGNLGATIEDIAWVVTGYAIANVIIIPMTGFLQQYFGRKNYYLASIVLFTVCSYLCAESTSLWELVFFRFMQGIGGGALLSTSQGILYDAWPREKRGVASGLFGMGIIVGPTIGPTLGGYIVEHYDWPLIFTINIPVGIVAFALTWFFVDRQPSEYNIQRSQISIDWLGIFLLVMGVGSLQTVLEKGESEDWFETGYIVWLTATAIIGLLGFVFWQLSRSNKNPVLNLRILKNPSFFFAIVLTFVGGYGLFASIFVFPVLTQRVLGYTAYESGFELLPGTLVALVVMPIMGRLLSSGTPPKYFIIPGFLFTILYCLWLSGATPDSGESFFFYPLLLRGLGAAMLTMPLIQQSIAGIPPPQMPAAISIANMIRQLGGAFGIAITNTYVVQRIATHRVDLISHIQAGDPNTEARLQAIKAGLAGHVSSMVEATQAAYRQLDGIVNQQAALQGYLDSFILTALFFCLAFPLIFLTRNPTPMTSQQQQKLAESAH